MYQGKFRLCETGMFKCFFRQGQLLTLVSHLISTVGEAELDRPDFPVPAGPVDSGSQLRLQGIKARVAREKHLTSSQDQQDGWSHHHHQQGQ